MAMHPHYDDLVKISRRDPDTWTTSKPPTSRDYAEFANWVREVYGENLLATYYNEPWALRGTDEFALTDPPLRDALKRLGFQERVIRP